MPNPANATPPTDEGIRGATIRIIASFAQRDPAALTGAEELVRDLHIPDVSLPFLRNSLLGLMNHFNPDGRLRVADLRRPHQTVNGVVEIVQREIVA